MSDWLRQGGKYASIAIACAVVMAAPAYARENPFRGGYIGLGGGLSKSDIRVTDGDADFTYNFSKGQGFGTIFTGYNRTFGSAQNTILGLEAFVEKIVGKAQVETDDVPVVGNKAVSKAHFGVAGRLGKRVPHTRFMPYLRAGVGYEMFEFTFDEVKDVGHVTLSPGAGVDIIVGHNARLRFEAQYRLSIQRGTISETIDWRGAPSNLQVLTSLVAQF